MAPKKKVVKKGGKKGGKKKDKDAEGVETTGELSVLDKNYYLTQIQAHERNIERVNQRCDQLSNAEKHAREQYRNLHQEKVDIVCFLRESLKSREDEIEELKSRLSGLVKARQTERDEYEDKLKHLHQELEHVTADLSDQILSLTRKLESLEEFRLQKNELEANHSLLQKTLNDEREVHQEKISILERSLIEESEAIRIEQEEKLVKITEKLRKDAREEMHSTTRTALMENEGLTRSLTAINNKVIKLRHETLDLRNELSEQHTREAVLQDLLTQMTSIAERRALILTKVVEKADEHSKIYKEYQIVQEDKEKLRRDLQQLQVQLDAATRNTFEQRENLNEKTLSLELLSTKLQEERLERRRITAALSSALKILQESIFEGRNATSSDNGVKKSGISNVTLTQLVDILSGAENHPPHDEGSEEANPIRSKTDKGVAEPLVTYSAGDLGLVPKKMKGQQKGS